MPRHGKLAALPRLCSIAAWLAAAAAAQAEATPPGAGASAADSASARAQREADKVFQWIRIHSDQPRKAPAAAAAEKPPAPVRSAVRPAKPPGAAIAKTLRPPAAPPSGPPVATAAAAAPAPAAPPVVPTVAVAAPRPAEPPPAAAAAAAEEDETLTPVHRTEPEFAPSLMRSLRRGIVQVAFTVQPDGSVADARVLAASHPRLGPSAVATVAQWRFKPLRHAQQARVDVGFDLD